MLLHKYEKNNLRSKMEVKMLISYIKKRSFIIAILIIAIYSSIGYIFEIEPLKVFIINKNSFNVSIIGIAICCFTGGFIEFIIKYFGQSRNNK
jgi:hypothetical protein